MKGENHIPSTTIHYSKPQYCTGLGKIYGNGNNTQESKAYIDLECQEQAMTSGDFVLLPLLAVF